jgi:prevent-host-death family protein
MAGGRRNAEQPLIPTDRGDAIALVRDLAKFFFQMNVTIHQAKTNLSKLIQEAIHGEEVIISKGNQPMVRITPLKEALPERKLGGATGVVKFMSPNFNDEIDDFDEA